MANFPWTASAIDVRSDVELTDYDPRLASFDLLRLGDDRQHGLLTAWGGRPTWITMHDYIAAGATLSTSLQVRVPPAVQFMGFRLLMGGKLNVELNTSDDSANSLFMVRHEVQVETSVNQGLAELIDGTDHMAGVTLMAGTPRPLRVVTSPSWAWASAVITVSLSVGPGTLWGIELHPLHRPQ